MSGQTKHTPGPWVVVPNDGAYVKRPELGTLRIEERGSPDEMVLAIVVTDCPRLKDQAHPQRGRHVGRP